MPKSFDCLEKYIKRRKKADPQFAEEFEEGFEEFKQKLLKKKSKKLNCVATDKCQINFEQSTRNL